MPQRTPSDPPNHLDSKVVSFAAAETLSRICETQVARDILGEASRFQSNRIMSKSNISSLLADEDDASPAPERRQPHGTMFPEDPLLPSIDGYVSRPRNLRLPSASGREGPHTPGQSRVPSIAGSRSNPSTPLPSTGHRQNLTGNISAPNLSTYIQHIHHYTFNGPCTIYQGRESEEGGVQIHTQPGTYTYRHETRNAPRSRDGQASRYGPDTLPGGRSFVGQGEGRSEAPFTANQGATPVFPRYLSRQPENDPLRGEHPDSCGATQGPSRDGRGPELRHQMSWHRPAVQRVPPSTTLEPPLKRRATRHASEKLLHPQPVITIHPPASSGMPGYSSPRVRNDQGVESIYETRNTHPSPSSASRPPPTGPVAQAYTRSVSDASPRASDRRFAAVYQRDQDKVKKEKESIKDWHTIIDMYETGAHTKDGVPLKMIAKGSTEGTHIDRKVLEKYRTIGSTHALLGRRNFEIAIGYSTCPETGKSKRTPLYQVTPRCRIVKELQKNGNLPSDPEKVRDLVLRRELEKERRKEATRAIERHESPQGEAAEESRRSRPVQVHPPGFLRQASPRSSEKKSPEKGPSVDE